MHTPLQQLRRNLILRLLNMRTPCDQASQLGWGSRPHYGDGIHSTTMNKTYNAISTQIGRSTIIRHCSKG